MTEFKTLKDLKVVWDLDDRNQTLAIPFVQKDDLRSLIISRIKALPVWCECGKRALVSPRAILSEIHCPNTGEPDHVNILPVSGTCKDIGAYKVLMELGDLTEEDLR